MSGTFVAHPRDQLGVRDTPQQFAPQTGLRRPILVPWWAKCGGSDERLAELVERERRHCPDWHAIDEPNRVPERVLRETDANEAILNRQCERGYARLKLVKQSKLDLPVTLRASENERPTWLRLVEDLEVVEPERTQLREMQVQGHPTYEDVNIAMRSGDRPVQESVFGDSAKDIDGRRCQLEGWRWSVWPSSS